MSPQVQPFSHIPPQQPKPPVQEATDTDYVQQFMKANVSNTGLTQAPGGQTTYANAEQ